MSSKLDVERGGVHVSSMTPLSPHRTSPDSSRPDSPRPGSERIDRPRVVAVPIRRPRTPLIRIAPGARQALSARLERSPSSLPDAHASGTVLWVRPGHPQPLVIARCSPPIPQGYAIERVDGFAILFEESWRERLRDLRVEFVPGEGGGFLLQEPDAAEAAASAELNEAALACTTCASAHLPPLPEEWAAAAGRSEGRGPSLPVLPGAPV